MTRRRRRLLALLAAASVLLVLSLPAVHWRLTGWARGEPFWHGRPALYYSRAIRRAFDAPGPNHLRKLSAAERRVRGIVGQGVADAVWGGPPPFDPCDWGGRTVSGDWPDAEALPLLVALASDADARVRFDAAAWLPRSAHRDPARAVPALAQLLDDPAPEVRFAAASGLGRCGLAALPAVGRLRELRTDSTPVPVGGTVGDWAAAALVKIHANALEGEAP